MKVSAINLCPPNLAKDNLCATPELLASCLARYSRSNKGIESIFETIDWNNPEKSVDAIFKFVDYGHASITGLSGGIAIALDGISMYLAYKIFEFAQLCDGQESSTRYIKLDTSSLPTPDEIGIPEQFHNEWKYFMSMSFELYHEIYSELDKKAQENPSIVKLPQNATENVITRLRKNYALDRARYFIPFATKTNAAYVMTARVWVDTLKRLDSLPIPEAQNCASLIRKELEKIVPRMIKHSYPDKASKAQTERELQFVKDRIKSRGMQTKNLPDQIFLTLNNELPPFLSSVGLISDSFNGKENRYSNVGTDLKRIMVRAAWNNMAIAEIRDLNRHRTGFRFSTLSPDGFYIPEEVTHERLPELLLRKRHLVQNLLLNSDSSNTYVYGLLLGTQCPFEHSTHADKFIYEIELRTGMGAHFRYAQHLTAAYNELISKMPELKDFITLGTAEPE